MRLTDIMYAFPTILLVILVVLMLLLRSVVAPVLSQPSITTSAPPLTASTDFAALVPGHQQRIEVLRLADALAHAVGRENADLRTVDDRHGDLGAVAARVGDRERQQRRPARLRRIGSEELRDVRGQDGGERSNRRTAAAGSRTSPARRAARGRRPPGSAPRSGSTSPSRTRLSPEDNTRPAVRRPRAVRRGLRRSRRQRERRVARSTPTTAGKPYSRAITAPWVIRPPTSVTSPLIATNRGDQLGSV